MHDIKWIRDNPAAFDRALARRGLPASAQTLIGIDERRRAAIVKIEQAQARRNAASKEIGEAKKARDTATADALMAEVAALKEAMPALDADEKEVSRELDDALSRIPNLPLDDVPDGVDEHGNVEHHRFGARGDYAFTPRQHFELGEALGMMDFELAAKLSGSRFVVLKRGLARLERALGQFMLDLHTTEHGYTEIAPPLMVQDEVVYGTAQLPKSAVDMFMTARNMVEYLQTMDAQLDRIKIADTPGTARDPLAAAPTADQDLNRSLWLIPTAEVPLTNMVRDAIRDEADLPLRLTACTPCFRAEAGAAGKDTRGMIRQHQFMKVELVSIVTPENSRAEHERMLSCAEEVLRRLGLHYRVVTLCAGDMGFAAQKTFDIEVWLPGQGMFREISSCSTCGDFQARRMAARYRTREGRQVRHLHTLNGSGVAVGRALIAIMETYQQADGSIAIPDVLQSYMGGMKTVAAN